jgi:hypothetical protein
MTHYMTQEAAKRFGDHILDSREKLKTKRARKLVDVSIATYMTMLEHTGNFDLTDRRLGVVWRATQALATRGLVAAEKLDGISSDGARFTPQQLDQLTAVVNRLNATTDAAVAAYPEGRHDIYARALSSVVYVSTSQIGMAASACLSPDAPEPDFPAELFLEWANGVAEEAATAMAQMIEAVQRRVDDHRVN